MSTRLLALLSFYELLLFVSCVLSFIRIIVCHDACLLAHLHRCHDSNIEDVSIIVDAGEGGYYNTMDCCHEERSRSVSGIDKSGLYRRAVLLRTFVVRYVKRT